MENKRISQRSLVISPVRGQHFNKVLLFLGEVFTYYLEHVLLLAIPLYLILFGGPSFEPEPAFDFGYSLFHYALFGVYNFAMLQPLGSILQNHISAGKKIPTNFHPQILDKFP
jgi:hypothetical protein